MEDKCWDIIFIVDEIGVKKTINLNSLSTIGSCILELISRLTDMHKDWTQFELWNPVKKSWLLNRKSTLMKYDLYNEYTLHFIRNSVPAYVLLPNMCIIRSEMKVHLPVIEIVKNICNTLNIRHYQEWALFKGPALALDVIKHVGSYRSLLDLTDPQNGPDSSFKESVCSNVSFSIPNELSNVFPIDTATANDKTQQNMKVKWSEFHRNCLLTTTSLKEQNINENEFLIFRIKYFYLYDLNIKLDMKARIPLAFNQALLMVKYGELQTVTKDGYDENLFHLASLLWHSSILYGEYRENNDKKIQQAGKLANVKCASGDDLDMELEMLEADLERDYTKKNTVDTTKTDTPAKAGQSAEKGSLSVMPPQELFVSKCSNSKMKGKNYVVSIQSTRVYFKEPRGEPCAQNELKGGKVTSIFKYSNKKTIYFINFSQYSENNDTASNVSKFELKFEDEQTFAHWFVVLRNIIKGIILSPSQVKNSIVLVMLYLKMRQASMNHAKAAEEKGRTSSLLNGSQDNVLAVGGAVVKVQDILPKSLFKFAPPEEVADKIFAEYDSISNLKYEETLTTFLKKWAIMPFSDLIPFNVQSHTGTQASAISKKSKGIVLGMSRKKIYELDLSLNHYQNSIISERTLSSLKEWSVNWSSKCQVLAFADGKKLFLSSEFSEVDIRKLHETISGVIFNVVVSERKTQDTDNELEQYYRMACV